MNPTSPKFCIGLTGGIGCGKSTVARLFEAQGASIIDTDEIAHQLTQADGEGIAPVLAAFGDDYIAASGAMDRAKMRSLILTDSAAKQKLEQILHPLILRHSKERLLACNAAPYVILMAPLLLESPAFLQLVQRILLVDCDEQNQISRVMLRSGLMESEIRGIIALQTSRTARLAGADDIINNNGNSSELPGQVAALHRQYLSRINNHLTAS